MSILNYVLGAEPETVSAQGQAYIQSGIEDVAFLHLRYPGDIVAHTHVSLAESGQDPADHGRGAARKMLVYDDVSTTEKIRVYDKGVTVQPHYDTFGEFQLSYRFGDIYTPRLDDNEPLKNECQHFVQCIQKRETPRSGGHSGLAVVRVMERACESIRKNGEQLPLVLLPVNPSPRKGRCRERPLQRSESAVPHHQAGDRRRDLRGSRELRLHRGPALDRFEKNFAEYCATKHAIGLASGTAALHVSFAAMDIGPGDEIITTPWTFIATVEAISQTGASVRFVDCRLADGCMDPEQLEAARSRRARRRSCPCTSSASPATWTRSSRSRIGAACP